MIESTANDSDNDNELTNYSDKNGDALDNNDESCNSDYPENDSEDDMDDEHEEVVISQEDVQQ